MVAPLWILAIGIAIVLISIVALRLNAFVGLITAAVVVSFLSPGEIDDKAARVATAFGDTAAGIGIAIVLAAVIGNCLIASGAADRIVQAFLALFGESRGAGAMATSGFVLSVPVFFDTVFYLLFPLAKSMYRRTGRHYLRYLLAIGAGGAVAHTMVPPTPGPLLMAEELNVNVGVLMLAGCAVGVPMTLSGLVFAAWRDRRMTLELEPLAEQPTELDSQNDLRPNLFVALLPILVPIVMIAAGPIGTAFLANPPAVLNVIADKNLALLVAAFVALAILVATQRPTRKQVADLVQDAVVGAGSIVLITAAGGAFGGMLKLAGVGPAIEKMFTSDTSGGGFAMLWLAFGIASLMKCAQGSTTIALVTASGMVAAMQQGMTPTFHPVYLCTAIGSGAMITSWMNDSGFWIFCRMGRLTEREGLTTWSPIMAIMGVTGMAATLIFATLWPAV